MKQLNLFIACLFLLVVLGGSQEAKAQCQPRLGVSLFHDCNAFEGVPITHIVKNSPAMEAGLAPGDFIISINDVAVNNRDEIVNRINNFQHGSTVTIKYVRNNGLFSTTATLKCLQASLQEECHTVWAFEEVGATMTTTDVQVEGTKTRQNPVLTNNITEIKEVSVYPNPSTGLFNVAFQISNPATTYVRILDLNGKELKSYDLGRYSGTYVKAVDVSDIALMGVYIVQVISGETIVNKQVVIQR